MTLTLAGNFLLATIPILISFYTNKYREADKLNAFPDDPLDLNLPVRKSFDFIIVGGGTAGCIVARRLVDANFSVLVIEAGGNPPPLQAVPLTTSTTMKLPEINFQYKSALQKNAGLITQGISNVSLGKMMGGCSSHNGLKYERGNPLDYDQWARLTRDRSWRYKNILKFYKKSENYRGGFKLKGAHGQNGTLTVERTHYAPAQELWLKAGRELGYKIRDPNGPQQIGFSPHEYYLKNGRRLSTYDAYIKNIEKKSKKLTIHRYSLVSQVLIKNKKATGVLYTRHGMPMTAKARKEVILSAGSIVSPILLMKSGIGPKDQLAAAKIDPVNILPVGENLMDHVIFSLPIDLRVPIGWKLRENLTFDHFTQFLNKGEGPLAGQYVAGQAEAYLASSRAIKMNEATWPDLQINFFDHRQELTAGSTIGCSVALGRPLSRGRLTFNLTSDIGDDNLPIIDYNFYSVASDLDVTMEGIEFCLKVMERTEAFKEYGAKFIKEFTPQCNHKTFRSRDYWICVIRLWARPMIHAGGTCRMGTRDDARSVVDSKLRVLGVRDLRVVDASIMPVITNGNIVGPVIAISEKASRQIIKKYSRKNNVV